MSPLPSAVKLPAIATSLGLGSNPRSWNEYGPCSWFAFGPGEWPAATVTVSATCGLDVPSVACTVKFDTPTSPAPGVPLSSPVLEFSVSHPDAGSEPAATLHVIVGLHTPPLVPSCRFSAVPTVACCWPLTGLIVSAVVVVVMLSPADVALTPSASGPSFTAKPKVPVGHCGVP